MRPTERTRTPTPAPRPAERLVFTSRQILLTTWDQRAKMTPGEEVAFGYQRMVMFMHMRNAGQSPEAAAVAEFHALRAGVPDPEAAAPAGAVKPRRKPAPAPV